MEKIKSKKKAYELMLTSRILDEFCEELYRAGTPLRHYHSGIGQEACAVGGTYDLREDDYLYYAHRGVGVLLAKGLSLKAVMYDLFLKPGGTNQGLGSAMHTCAPELGLPGRAGVFGFQFTFSAGSALGAKLQGKDSVAVCYYGEAAGSRGPYFEALNMAVLWKLPVIYFAETNGFSTSSRTEDLFATGDMSSMWKGFDIPIAKVDGNDLNAVRAATQAAIERGRSGKGPSVIECMTYRISPHIPGDKDDTYRSLEEVEYWKKKDPILRAKRELAADGALSEAEDAKLRSALRAEVEALYAEIQKTPVVSKSEAFRVLYFADVKTGK